METILKSKTKTVTISPENPFVIIGERINPTGRKKLTAELEENNLAGVARDAESQVQAGAHVLDVNVGVSGIDEVKTMIEAIKIITQITDVPLCFDSSKSEVLDAALKLYEGRALVNSVSGEEEKLKKILPLVKEYDAAVIALPLDDTGIPKEPEKRFAIAARIVEQAEKIGIKREDIIIDCLTMTLSADHEAAKLTLETMKLVQKELGCNMSLGVSNVSYGLPDRDVINAIFLVAAIENGLTCAIIDPTKEETKRAIVVSELIKGRDNDCLKYIQLFRNKVRRSI
ncbi:dihydropteroate synthase [Candidatus Formimonas warabiya]|uniref:Pterin-binding protein n=1 Tax=Formimonas warabiya TaxID=1761012 RepID=A0A3G1KMU9_FORW1|nr:dihydropteroate synthase [Candidatus Formimonas warabiya]ATW23766.1 pterin-binding protein [Candidatus Formimonas warabiya]